MDGELNGSPFLYIFIDMWKPIYQPEPWPQYVKRKENVGVPLMEVRKKYLEEQLLFENYVSSVKQLNVLSPSNGSKGGCAGSTPITDANIREAVALFYSDEASAECIYGPIEEWDVSAVTNMRGLFPLVYDHTEGLPNFSQTSKFNRDISGWDVSNVTDMSYMFYRTRGFNQDLSGWDVSNVTGMSYMFYTCNKFNQDLNDWDVSQVTDMSFMFVGCKDFDGDLSNWNTENVTTMQWMFQACSNFNSDISNWNIGNVTTIYNMFGYTQNFNSDISNWNTENVTDMSRAFEYSSFNQDISNWNTENVTSMGGMFKGSSFNQDISNWNTGNVIYMGGMFRESSFDQNLGAWNISNVTSMVNMLTTSTQMSDVNYSDTLIGWAAQTVQPGVRLDANATYTGEGATARSILTGAPNEWDINDLGGS